MLNVTQNVKSAATEGGKPLCPRLVAPLVCPTTAPLKLGFFGNPKKAASRSDYDGSQHKHELNRCAWISCRVVENGLHLSDSVRDFHIKREIA
ncbi:hypothetical protein [Mesorhizobium sp. B2-1-2]|uniref:hypothetical protein n=1 Tax=Mesorhizobium sp. B2-1-2 TaxID=2589973 RepID=UPI00112D25E3|nr:hypothetical protein [Mesorhizobium sp. B2-1-2]TPN04495.1 hypothetical protein FJ971_29560 [Mesorhizobium sp. B2-1-2]